MDKRRLRRTLIYDGGPERGGAGEREWNSNDAGGAGDSRAEKSAEVQGGLSFAVQSHLRQGAKSWLVMHLPFDTSRIISGIIRIIPK